MTTFKLGPVLLALSVIPSLPAHAETPSEVAKRYGLSGELLVAKGAKIEVHQAFGKIAPSGKAPHRIGERWRLASITKQVTAALLLRDHFNELDTVTDTIGPLKGLTLRGLLTHHSGLANPDDSPTKAGSLPSFYLAKAPDLTICRSRAGIPNSAFSYNNCDYLLAADRYGDRVRWPSGMVMSTRGQVGMPGFVKSHREPRFNLASFGAAGGLLGTARAVLAFNQDLMNGGLLPPLACQVLWTAEGGRSYQALGAWVFPAKLKGCSSQKRIVQRDGEIAGVQARNFMLPDDGLSVIVFTNRSSDDFSFGEVWQQSGFAYDLLSAAACGATLGS